MRVAGRWSNARANAANVEESANYETDTHHTTLKEEIKVTNVKIRRDVINAAVRVHSSPSTLQSTHSATTTACHIVTYVLLGTERVQFRQIIYPVDHINLYFFLILSGP